MRRPRRARAVAMLATPPGLEPMPRAQDSVPRTGALSRPVKMMSRKTVPVRKTSQAGSVGSRRRSSGSTSASWCGCSPLAVVTADSPVAVRIRPVCPMGVGGGWDSQEDRPHTRKPPVQTHGDPYHVTYRRIPSSPAPPRLIQMVPRPRATPRTTGRSTPSLLLGTPMSSRTRGAGPSSPSSPSSRPVTWPRTSCRPSSAASPPDSASPRVTGAPPRTQCLKRRRGWISPCGRTFGPSGV